MGSNLLIETQCDTVLGLCRRTADCLALVEFEYASNKLDHDVVAVDLMRIIIDTCKNNPDVIYLDRSFDSAALGISDNSARYTRTQIKRTDSGTIA